MKIAIITDLHLDYRKAEDKFFDFFMKFYEEIFFPFLKKNTINIVFNLGDTFDHRKTLDILAVNKVKNRFFDYLYSNNIEFNMLVGNHDIYYRHSNEVNTPEIILSDYSNIKIYSEIQDILIDKLKVTLCPWINNENRESVLSHISQSNAKVLFGHLELNNFELHSGFYMSGSEYNADMFSNYEKVFSGHYHHRSNKDNIYYLGNPYQMTWSDWKDTRGYHVFDTETLELTFYRNPFTLFEKIYYNDRTSDYTEFKFENYKDKFVKIIVEEKNSDKDKFELFLQRLEQNSPHEVKILDKLEELEIQEQQSDDDVLTMMLDYVTNTYELDKQTVRTTLNTIYQETIY